MSELEPVYINEFKQPVHKVNNAHISSIPKTAAFQDKLYELQLNNQYYQISEDMLKTLVSICDMSDNVSVSIG